MSTLMRLGWWMLLLSLACSAFMGCSSTPKMGQYTFVVSPDESLRSGGSMVSFEVDIVGVTELDKPTWEAQNVDDYFSPRNARRANATRHTMSFSNQQPQPQTLRYDAQVWNTWRNQGAMHVVLLASIPGSGVTSTGGDTRRLVLPLSTARWNDRQQINIVVKSDGVQCVSAMKPEKVK
ncbi:MAG: hypothetical protein HRU76_12080 [Phycisphaeraceae bacterium]|nr:MAG: hypothetical protein HRU76_12080 [Phycisphaeraceae bacterium]